MAHLIPAEGPIREVQPAAGAGGKFTLKELQTFVGGYIERVPNLFREPGDMLVNEDGRRLGLPWNPNATLLAGRPIVGDAIVLDRDEWE